MAAPDKTIVFWCAVLALGLGLLAGCTHTTPPPPPDPAPAHIQQEYGILQALYGQFKVFRRDPLFLRHGFTANSPHAPWLQTVQSLRTQPALAEGAAILADLAIATRIHGEDSQTTKNFETRFVQFLAGQPGTIEPASVATNAPTAPAVTAATGASVTPPAQGRTAEPVQIVFSGDTQGVLQPQPGPNGPVGGLQQRLVAIAKVRIQEPGAILLDAGDMFSPTSKTAEDNARTLIQTMNRAGYRAAGLGPHDLALGATTLGTLAKDASFPFLCANMQATAQLDWLKPYVLLQTQNCTVAVISILPQPGQPLPDGMRYVPARTALNSLLPALRHQADYIVLLTQCDSGEIHDLADVLEGVDVILGDYRSGKEPRYVRATAKGMGLGLVTLNKASYRNFGLEQHRTLMLDGTW